MLLECMWQVRNLPNSCFEQLERCMGGTMKKDQNEEVAGR